MPVVCVIEDNPQNQYLMKFLLEKKGFEVIQARDTENARKIITETPRIDLILLDIQLKEKNGLSLIGHIKSTHPDAIIVALSSFVLKGDKERALQEGCDYFIEKPIQPEKFLAFIESILSQKAG